MTVDRGPTSVDAFSPGDAEPALILTLALDPITFDLLDSLRRRHFPPALNLIPAHLTLFHKLPGDRLEAVAQSIAAAAPPAPIPLTIAGLRLLGRGVAFEVSSPPLGELRAHLARHWRDVLTPQDRQAFHPHVTIQNKTSPPAARALRDDLARTFQPIQARGVGVLVWRYLQGPWRLERRVDFDGGDRP